jgi:hypothetical protein
VSYLYLSHTQESEVSPKPRRRSSGNLSKGNSDVSPNASSNTEHSPLPRGRRTNRYLIILDKFLIKLYYIFWTRKLSYGYMLNCMT